MHSSTSNSNDQTNSHTYRNAILLALAMIVLLLACTEAAFRFGFSRISRIESRTMLEHQNAIAVRSGINAKPTILVLGNSLLLEGVDFEQLKLQLDPWAKPTRFVIEQTAFLDWSYGIKRLLSDGAKPDRIILCLNLPQFVANSIRGDHVAFYLYRTSDLLNVGKDSGYDLTKTSGLLFARYSLFFAGRNSLRNFVLNRLQPAYGELLHGFTTASAPDLNDEKVLQLAAPRLEQLRKLCNENGIQFAFLLPPGFGDGSQGLIQAGINSATTVLAPVALNEWDKDQFRDGFHLSKAGSERFTKLVSEKVRLTLNQ